VSGAVSTGCGARAAHCLESTFVLGFWRWCRGEDSNLRPTHYEFEGLALLQLYHSFLQCILP
jgi:hypothetical protein